MNEKDYQKIIEEISSKLSIENRRVEANILALKNKLNAEGILNSGRCPDQLNNYCQILSKKYVILFGR